MLSLPSVARSIVMSSSLVFTWPTFRRAILLAVGAIVTMRSRTITGVLWTPQGAVGGHPGTYHRIFLRPSWSWWPLGEVPARALLSPIPSGEPVLVPMDDTAAQHRGQYVYGKGCHHDAARTTPCLLGLFRVICPIHAEHIQSHPLRIR